MAEVIINKKLLIRNIFKKIVESKFQELEENIFQKINDDLKLVVTSTLEVVKRKVAAIKKLEDETMDIWENKEQLEQLVIESTGYEIYTKQNIARFSEFVNKNLPINTDRKVESNVERASANVRLPKLDILNFAREPAKWSTFIDSYETAINSSSNLSNIEKFNYLNITYNRSIDTYQPKL